MVYAVTVATELATVTAVTNLGIRTHYSGITRRRLPCTDHIGVPLRWPCTDIGQSQDRTLVNRPRCPLRRSRILGVRHGGYVGEGFVYGGFMLGGYMGGLCWGGIKILWIGGGVSELVSLYV